MRTFPVSSHSSTCLSSRYFFCAALAAALWVWLSAAAVGQNAAREAGGAHPLITQAVDESQLTTLKGNTHPLARPQFDLGTAPATLPMERMLLVLKRNPDQETALAKLLDDQQDKSSANYHKWLTPEEFGKQFGPSDADMQTITSWLQSHGFEVGASKGRTVLEFSGSASQVQEAFHTSIHKYIVNGEQHWANASDPMIPTALVGAVAGVLTLHNFVKQPASHFSVEKVPAKVVAGKKPDVTFTQNGQVIHALAPQDYAVIYNIGPAYGIPATYAPNISVVGRSDIYNGGEDILDFRSEVGTGENGSGGYFFDIIYNGPNPGNSGGGDEAEAILDSTWSRAIAPLSSSVTLVVSGTTNTTDGTDLSEQYIIENNLSDIMTESFSSCEYFATDAQIAGTNAMAEQAAAQGITYLVSTGDNGAEGCDDPSVPPAKGPLSVNVLASTPFNIAVGGTMFNDESNPSQYWGSNPPISESAISYIPENAWNESSATSGLWAGSGGASAGNFGNNQISPPGTTTGIAKPSWQSVSGLNIPLDGVRDLPDVALTAAAHDPYLLCFEGSCVPNSQGEFFVYFISGTSAAAPSFAGIMALVDGAAGERQGQANYVLYSLAASQAAQGIYPAQCNGSSTGGLPAGNCIFNDVTVGNNVVPGETGSLYQAGAGYDLTTGLGSVNVANMVTNWKTATFNATTTKLGLGSTTNITHGTPVSVSITVTPSSGTGVPTGDVSLQAENGPIDCYGPTAATDGRTLSHGSVSFPTSILPGGGPYCVWARYAGDGTYASSNSNTIMVTVKPEASLTSLTLQASDLRGNPVASPFPFGSLVFARADVASANNGTTVCQPPSFNGCPTGTVSFADTFGALPIQNPQVNPPVPVVPNPPLNGEGNTSIGDGIVSFDAGNHSISAIYNGDNSFSPSNAGTSLNFTILPGFALVSGFGGVAVTSPGLGGSTTVGFISSSNFNTAVSFTCSSGLPAEATCTSTPTAGQGPGTVTNVTITVTTTAPHATMLRSNDRRYYFAVFFGTGLPLVGIALVGSRRRRSGALAALVLMAILIITPGCGGGGGGSQSQSDPGTPVGSYTVIVTASASGAPSQTGQFLLTVK
jgi:hypothetical protein